MLQLPIDEIIPLIVISYQKLKFFCAHHYVMVAIKPSVRISVQSLGKGKIDSGLLKGVAFMDNRKAIAEVQKIFSL